jgi:hypothetical protein
MSPGRPRPLRPARRAALLLAALALLAGCDAGGAGADALEVRYVVAGAADITYTGTAGTAEASTGSAWEQRLAVPAGTALSLTAVSPAGAPVTASIFVDGRLARSRRGPGVRVDATADGGGEAEVEGFVEAVGAGRLTVLGLVFVVDGNTRLRDGAGRAVPFSAFALGTFVEVEGRPLGDGTFRATEVEIEDEGGDDEGGLEVEVDGTIQAIDAGSVTVAGRVFATTASTRYLDDDNAPVARSALTVGALVEAEGHQRADGTLVAEKVKLDDD